MLVLLMRVLRGNLSPRKATDKSKLRGRKRVEEERKTNSMMANTTQMMNLMLFWMRIRAVMMRVMMLGCSATRSFSDPAGVWSTTGTESIEVVWMWQRM